VRGRIFLTEHHAPLDADAHAFCNQLLGWLVGAAETLGLRAEDLAAWRTVSDRAELERLHASPDFLWREGCILTTVRALQVY
jgi:hypothetical protein